eukprot:CAMPEP_0203759240 /NCGR_PEP_ID=MMETSP0098-20131031/12201_1 /ASSEMBLY_ACC=CAM_ASM_000208 /TAXON_ID=96639 /ORGANISM=" , Strain NY0313808BC1" /LENGTH=595 /DNA_ID=CAMNT_0050652057 /DNA_START=214 /DNA_END=2001 /DNA_ORIENTATION=+
MVEGMGGPEVELVLVSSNAKCSYNGSQLRIADLQVGYEGGEVLFDAESVSLECGFVYCLVGPNGSGKSSFARLLLSKQIDGFPKDVSIQYLEPYNVKTNSRTHLIPQEYLEASFKMRLKEISEQIVSIETRLDEGLSSDEVNGLVARLGLLYEFQDELSERIKLETGVILDELGFAAAGLLETPVCNLSSGWRYKCDLAGALLSNPEILIVDEPSFLDQSSLCWFQKRLKDLARNGSFVLLISHKEDLLEAVGDRVLFISAAKKLLVYNCDYETFKTVRKDESTGAHKNVSKTQKQNAKTEASIRKLNKRIEKGAKTLDKVRKEGTQTFREAFVKGKSKEAKQKGSRALAARVKEMDKKVDALSKLETSLKEHRIHPIKLVGCQPQGTLISLNDVVFGYGEGVENVLLSKVSVSISAGDRVVLCGQNGAGKSTLIKLITGELVPLSGSVTRMSGVKIAYFQQNAIHSILAEGGKLSAEQYMMKLDPTLTELDTRTHLASFGLKGSMAKRPLSVLSAGQRVRLILAKEFLLKIPSLLILDEAAENLDVETTQILQDALSNFKGAILLVSHQDSFQRAFVPNTKWVVLNGCVTCELI